MTKDKIWAHFERKGYKVVACLNSGTYVVKPPHHGFAKEFDSLSAAHKYYFNY